MADLLVDALSPTHDATRPMARPEVDESSFMGDMEAGLLQAGQIIPGWNVSRGVRDIEAAGRIGDPAEVARSLGIENLPSEDAEALLAHAAELRARGTERIVENLPGVTDRSEEIAAIPMNPAAARLGQADTFGEGWDAARHKPAAEVKAATAHQLVLRRCHGRWEARATLDV